MAIEKFPSNTIEDAPTLRKAVMGQAFANFLLTDLSDRGAMDTAYRNAFVSTLAVTELTSIRPTAPLLNDTFNEGFKDGLRQAGGRPLPVQYPRQWPMERWRKELRDLYSSIQTEYKYRAPERDWDHFRLYGALQRGIVRYKPNRKLLF